jgi:hypothetical protein
MEKSIVVIDYNSEVGGVDLSDACLTSYCSMRRLKISLKVPPTFD